MHLRNMNKFESAKNKLSFRKSTSVEITDSMVLEEKYVVEKTSYVPDKKKIGEDLKAGKEVKGCTLLTKSNLIIK